MNPFLIHGYTSKKYFCDREDEMSLLKENIENGRNTVLFSWRRMGKTTLIKYFLEELKRTKRADTLYVDLLATRNVEEAIKAITAATYEKYGKTKKGLSQPFQRLIGRLGLDVSFDPNTGVPTLGFNMSKSHTPESSLQAIGEFLTTEKNNVVVAIDEFQQISHYSDENGEAVFRTWMQSFPKLRFIFSGSHRGIMTSMFTSEKRPFYRSAELMSLGLIEPKKYSRFIISHFKRGGKSISPEVIATLFDWSLGQTYTIQLICNKLYARYERVDAKEQESVLEEILNQESVFFSQYVNLLSKTQWKVLKAIAKNDFVKNPLSSDFIQSNKLKAASSVKTALNMLQKKEIVVKDGDSYRVHDIQLMRWIQRL